MNRSNPRPLPAAYREWDITVSIPLPATLGLLAAGALAAVVLGRQRAARSSA